MRRTTGLRLAALATIAGLGAGITPAAAGTDRGNRDGALVVASLVPETGKLSELAESLRVPVEIAVTEINAAGGVNDQPVTLVSGDEGDDLATAKASLDGLLTTNRVDAVIGPASSVTAVGLLPTLEQSRVLMCSGSNVAPDLSKPGIAGGYYFRTAPSDLLQPRALARLIAGDGKHKVGIIASDDAYGRTFAQELARDLRKEKKVRVVANESFSAAGDTRDAAVTKRVAKRKPDAVALIAFAEGPRLLQSMIAAGIGPTATQIYTTSGLDTSGVPAAVDAADPGVLAGVKGTTPASSPAGIEHPFRAAFAATGVADVFSAYYYDCTILTALAAVKAKSDDPVKMKRVFASNLEGKKSCSTFAECKQLLEQGKTIHYRGASSRFDTFSDHEPDTGVYEVYGWDAAGTKTYQKNPDGTPLQISTG